jgi:shikimate kinase
MAMRVFLIGYMGSGKSTVGKILSNYLDIPFFDTDLIIEEMIGKSINEIFDLKGEKFFRKLETDLILKIKKEKLQGIFATGGGMPCFNQNMNHINDIGSSFYLKCGIGVLVNRLSNSIDRPLIQSKSPEELKSFIAGHLGKRKEFYLQARYTVIGSRAPEKVATRIMQLLD